MVDFELIRSSRKTLAIEIKGDRVIVRAPMQTTERTAERFVSGHNAWINKQLEKNAERLKSMPLAEPLSEEEIKKLADSAKQIIPERVSFYANIMGLSYGRVTIRAQRTKWGSCSSKGNLNFNCLLMLTPPDILDSVVVHELCHLKEMNHSKRFYELVRKYYPNYDDCRKWLKENGCAIMGSSVNKCKE